MKRWIAMYKLGALLFFCLNSSVLSAQFDHQAVFPGLNGNDLLVNLQSDFKPNNILSFANGRDSLFASVWADNDSLSCIYTGFTRYLDPNLDPTQAAFNNGTNDGINTEHSYPQSMGADSGNARADLHHLFPSRVDVNTTRASLPYAEIPDSETSSWHYDGIISSQIPQENIDLYSEASSNAFEVREAYKGNMARAIFYFYTMYRSQADNANPNFFESQKIDLCNWHNADPVDEEEWTNSFKIASYQEGKANPFVLDCTLASRLYCNNISEACALVNTQSPSDYVTSKIYPNPVKEKLFIVSSPGTQLVSAQIINTSAEQVGSFNHHSQAIYVASLPAGFYILKLQFDTHTEIKSFLKL